MATRDRAAAGGEKPKKQKVEDVEDLLRVANVNTDAIWLWRRRGDRFDFIESRSPEAFRANGIRETTRLRTGGGEYKARIRSSNGQWGSSRMFPIEGEPRPLPTEAPAAVHASPSTPATHELPSWVEKIIVPAAVALVAGITNKLLSDPKTDPLVLELLKRSGRSEGVDALELQKIVMQAEERGEHRGREMGELAAGRGDGEGESVVSAIREAAPIFNRLLDRHDQEHAAARTSLPETRTMPPARSASPAANPSDIIPAWLRPFMAFKSFVLNAADAEHDPEPMAGMVIRNSDDATWLAIIEAENAGRLESDFYAAMPEMKASPLREKFAVGLLKEIRDALLEQAKEVAREEKKLPKKKAESRG